MRVYILVCRAGAGAAGSLPTSSPPIPYEIIISNTSLPLHHHSFVSRFQLTALQPPSPPSCIMLEPTASQLPEREGVTWGIDGAGGLTAAVADVVDGEARQVPTVSRSLRLTVTSHNNWSENPHKERRTMTYTVFLIILSACYD